MATAREIYPFADTERQSGTNSMFLVELKEHGFHFLTGIPCQNRFAAFEFPS
jgi:hypothetical protein